MDLSHEEADVDQVEALEMLPGYKKSNGDERLVLSQTLNLLRRENDPEVKGVAVRVLRGVLAQEREGAQQFFLDFLSCLQQNPSSLKFLEFSSPTTA